MGDGHRKFGGAVRGVLLRAARWAVVATAGATVAVMLVTSVDGGGGGRSAPITVTVPGEPYPYPYPYPLASTTGTGVVPLPGCGGFTATDRPGDDAPGAPDASGRRAVAVLLEPVDRPTGCE